jgi:hypothetical protein
MDGLFFIIIIWIGAAFAVATLGERKQVGYWGVFWASLLLSPVIGLIIALVSSNLNSGSTKMVGGDRFKISLDEAKKALFKGEIEKAISLYQDTLYYLHNDYKEVKGSAGMKRMDLISQIESKIEELTQQVENK